MQTNEIERVAVLGLGTMGHAIAQTFAAAGCTVTACDAVEAARASALDRIRSNLNQMAEERLVNRSSIDAIVNRVTIVERPEQATAEAQFVIEAVKEDLPLKQELFARLEESVSETAILASNTSTFPMTIIARDMRRPERAINTHWFNPPHLVPIVEIIPGERTAGEATATTIALLERIGKRAVRINRELPGFLVNRVQIAMIREVFHLLDAGVASAEDIDAAIRGSMGFRLAANGPLEIADFGGLEVWVNVYNGLIGELHSDRKVPRTVQQTVDAGHFGLKTGKGIYDYSPESAEQKRRQGDHRFMALARLFHRDEGQAGSGDHSPTSSNG